jgi:hypothetical protein
MKNIRCLLLTVIFLGCQISSLHAQINWPKGPMLVNAKINAQSDLAITPSATSSSHDFDFLVGKWTMDHKKLKIRFANNNEWEEFQSSDENHNILLGVGNTDTFKTTLDGKPFEGLTLRLFNPETRLWSLYWVASNRGVLDPPVVGSFEGNLGRFYTKDVFQGKPIIMMFVWDKTDQNNPVWYQAFSPDNGKTWEWNWTNVSHRVK